MLSVRDSGPGIPKEELPRVMQAFGQGSLAYQSAEGGTGLGLPIVKSLVELHGGQFELKSELRKGTEAIVLMPRERAMRPALLADKTPDAAAASPRQGAGRLVRSLRRRATVAATQPAA